MLVDREGAGSLARMIAVEQKRVELQFQLAGPFCEWSPVGVDQGDRVVAVKGRRRWVGPHDSIEPPAQRG